jgi:predicted TPR repeat methyltransferase
MRAARTQDTGPAAVVERPPPKRAASSEFQALYATAIGQFDRGAWDEALQTIRSALKLKFDSPEGWCLRGRLLMRLNQPEDALRSFHSALALQPDLTEALAGRASVLNRMDRPAEALVTLDRLLALKPGDADAWNDRGSVLVAMSRFDEALKSFERALAIEPDLLQAMSNRAVILYELRRLDEALSVCDAVLALKSDHAVCWNNRGNVLLALTRYEDAIESYDKALRLEPRLEPAKQNRELALMELKQLARCPPGYLRGLFDEFPTDYDERMVNTLYYRAHTHLRTLADRVLRGRVSGMRILDLGVGTGLVGDVFKDLTASGGRLDGVDLSPRMIEAAGKRGIYDQLIVGDIETVLQAFERSYHLILAADTMIYFGDLAPTFAGVAKRLFPGGNFIFAVERGDWADWEQTASRRFRHSDSYLRMTAADAGLEFVDSMACVLRCQGDEPVEGLAVALGKPIA